MRWLAVSQKWLMLNSPELISRADPLITVPIDFQRKTYEDPAIKTAEARKLHFGEEQHWRIYGNDFIDRLTSAGFEVELNRAEDIPSSLQHKFGVMENEHVFLCKKTLSTPTTQ